MLAPIRPKPIIPSCIVRASLTPAVAPGPRSPAPPSRCGAVDPRHESSPRRSCRCPPCRRAGRRTSRSSATTFTPPIGASLPGARLRMRWIVSPASCVQRTCSGESADEPLLLRRGGRRLDPVGDRLAELARQLAVDLAGIASGARGDLRREQRRDDAVLVRRPHRAVAAEEGGARALLAAEAERAVEQTVDEPLEADRHLVEPPAQLRAHAIDHRAAHHGLAHAGIRAPLRTMRGTGSGWRPRDSDWAAAVPSCG